MSNTPNLLPCPFCGGEARHLPGKSGYWIERVICDACHFHLLETGSHTAVERWNRRTPQPADCTRSHPHEDMSGYCLLRTEIARLANENARLRASQSVVREPLTDENVEAASRRAFPRWWNSYGFSLCGGDPDMQTPQRVYAMRGFMGGFESGYKVALTELGITQKGGSNGL